MYTNPLTADANGTLSVRLDSHWAESPVISPPPPWAAAVDSRLLHLASLRTRLLLTNLKEYGASVLILLLRVFKQSTQWLPPSAGTKGRVCLLTPRCYTWREDLD